MATIGTTGTYSTPQAWEDDAPATLTSVWLGELQNQTFTGTLVMSGSTSSSSNYKHLTTATGASFADNANKLTNALCYNTSNGAAIGTSSGYITPLVDLAENYARVSKVQLSTTASNSYPIRLNNTGNQLNQCIIEGARSARMANLDAPSGVVENCLFVQRVASATAILRSTDSCALINCTLVVPSDLTAASTGMVRAYTAAATFPNLAIFGATNAADTTGSTYSNCYCNDSTPPTGFTQVAYDTSTGSGFETTTNASSDFRIKTSSALKDAGTSTGAPSIDIVGTARSTIDVGCWEVAAAAGDTLMGQACL